MKELFILLALIYVSMMHGALMHAGSDWAYVSLLVLGPLLYLAGGITREAADYRKERSR